MIPFHRYAAAGIFVAVASVLVICVTFSFSYRYSSPQIALRVWPWNGEARSAWAGRLILNGDFDSARRIARKALSQVPGDAGALRAFGMVQPDSETDGRALRLMTLASKASRRDLQTNLWFIEYYVAKGNIPEAIRYYDYSLKTSADAEQILFPVLVPAMANPMIAKAVAGKLISRPVWMTSFLQYAFSSGAADGEIVPIVINLAHDHAGLSDDLKRQYAQRLAERGNMEGLSKLARGLGHPLVEGGESLDNVGGLPPSDWRLLSSSGLSVFPNPAGGISFVASESGPLAERVLHLPPGTYVLQSKPKTDGGGDAAQINWAVACLPTDKKVDSAKLGDATKITVPKDCSFQKVSLLIDSSKLSDGGEVAGNVSQLSLRKIVS